MAKTMHIQVAGYENGGKMPLRFATVGGGGKNVSIGVSWSMIDGAKSYALLFDDIAPVANNWVHWLVVDIDPSTTEIAEGAGAPAGSRELVTSWGKKGYDGPQPPVGSGNHEYVARIYALDVEKLNVADDAGRSGFLATVEPHVIASGTYSGFFER